MVAASNIVIFTVISDMTMSMKGTSSDSGEGGQASNVASTSALAASAGTPNGGSFEFVRTVGVGSFGKIHVVRYQTETSCKPLALKQIAKSNLLQSKRGVESAITERYVLHDLHHPFIMKAHETWQDLRYIYFVMDFASGGDIFSKLQKGELFS